MTPVCLRAPVYCAIDSICPLYGHSSPSPCLNPGSDNYNLHHRSSPPSGFLWFSQRGGTRGDQRVGEERGQGIYFSGSLSVSLRFWKWLN